MGRKYNPERDQFLYEISKLVMDYRVTRNKSLDEVSKKTGFTDKIISAYEKGHINMNLYALTKISKALDIDLNLIKKYI